MNFSFGICVSPYRRNSRRHRLSYLNEIIKSIQEQDIPNYEIILIGEKIKLDLGDLEKIRIIDFDEKIKPMWITKKKNILIRESKYENVVLMHDYVKLEDGWYQGFLKFGNDFKVCVTKIKNQDGSRYRDYVFYIDYFDGQARETLLKGALIPYDVKATLKLNNKMYISGAYFVLKKEIGLKVPLDENRVWCESEDVKWCSDLNNANILFECNPYSSVRLLKLKEQGDWGLYEADKTFIDSLS